MCCGTSNTCQSKSKLLTKDLTQFQLFFVFDRFKWTHLAERLAYEKAVHHQRLRTEISQAKREADFFKTNVEKSKRMSRKRGAAAASSSGSSGGGGPGGGEQHSPTKRVYEFRQKETDSVIRKRASKKAKRDSIT